MTVSSQTSNETFNGNGVTTVWSLPFRFFHDDEIFVYVVDPTAQTTTPLVLGTDYTLTGAGLPEQFGTAPGKITTTVPVANLKQLYVERIMAVEQMIDIINQARFFPEVHEDAFDRLTMLIQQNEATVRGAIRVAIADPEPTRLPSAALRANMLMGFDSLGNPIPVTDTSGSAAALALQLANASLVSQGAAMIGRGGQVVKTIAELKTLLNGSPSKHAFVAGYYAQGDGGGGFYWLDATDTTSADNGGSIIVAADGGRWKLDQAWGATFCQFGAKGDGTTNDSAACQSCIDACKGRLVVADAGKVFFVAGLSMTGATYNLTTIRCDGWLKLRPDAGGAHFGNAWVGLLIKDCNGVKADVRFDGNRTAMTQREQIFLVGIAGASNVNLPSLEFKEQRGDGLYVGQSDWLANSTIPSNIRVGRVSAINSADDGRNAVTIIAVNGFDMQTMTSLGVGGTVNGVIQPGGFDVEPDFGYEICTDIHVGYMEVVTAGTNGVGIFGKSVSGVDANQDWNCTDIRIDNFRVLKTGTSGSALTAPQFTRVADLQVKGTFAYNTVRGQGPNIDFAQRVTADFKLTNVTFGAMIGVVGALNDFRLNIDVNGYNGAGVQVVQCTRGRITGKVWGALAGSTAFGIQLNNRGRSVTIQDVAFEVDVPYDGVNVRALRNEPGSLVTIGTGCIVRNCDWSGYSSFSVTNDALIRTENVQGYTDAAAVPANGAWFQGVFVKNNVPTSVAGKTTIGWIRANTSANNVLTTDWYACVVTNT